MNKREHNSSEEEILNDGMFKIPLPKKKSAFQKVCPQKEILQNKERNIEDSNKHLLKLIYKLVKYPRTLSKVEREALSSHPIIRKLIQQTKGSNSDSKSFYIPLDALLNYKDSESTNNSTYHQEEMRSNEDEHLHNLNFKSEKKAIAQTSTYHKIGFYTKEERMIKIEKI